MSLENAQEVMQRAFIHTLRRGTSSIEESLALAQVDLLYDLIEEVRWLRNDLYMLKPNNKEP